MATYSYDAFGHRVATTVNGIAREFLFDAGGHMTSMMRSNPRVWDRGELYAGGWHVASYVGGSTYFNHADWLGTVRVRTGPTGIVSNSYTSLPFGDCLSASGGCPSTFDPGATPAHFTDQDRDAESQLDHFMFRQYSSTQGRWMTPDPAGMAVVDPTNPQTWNRYAYVTNYPVGAVDPLGLKQPYVQAGALIGSYIGDFSSMGGGGYIVYTSGGTINGAVWETTATYTSPEGETVALTDQWAGVSFGPGGEITGTWVGGTGVGTSFGAGDVGNFGVVGDFSGGSAANKAPCGTGGFHGSLGLSYGGSADAGAGYEGITATGSGGVGLFRDNNTGTSAGAFAGGGATAYFFNGNVGAPKQQGQPFSFGGFAGVGPSLWFSNARSAKQLSGPFTTLSLNVGAGPVKSSLQLSYGGGIWQLSIGLPIPYVSAGTPSISVSKLTTKTATTSGCH